MLYQKHLAIWRQLIEHSEHLGSKFWNYIALCLEVITQELGNVMLSDLLISQSETFSLRVVPLFFQQCKLKSKLLFNYMFYHFPLAGISRRSETDARPEDINQSSSWRQQWLTKVRPDTQPDVSLSKGLPWGFSGSLESLQGHLQIMVLSLSG